MAITDLEREKIAEADKKAQRKANTLGADRPLVEEPFGNSNIVLKEDLFARTPTAITGFAAPDYGDAPTGGAVATRHIELRLHPLVTSGIDGYDTIQTYVVVHTTPESDDPVDIEAVRIKHLVPPDLSLGRSHAAESDGYLRGFEMALYPAFPHPYEEDVLIPASKNSQILLGYVDGYFDGYQIPLSADPGAEYGMGNEGRIAVDYANGIVRLSRPALQSPQKSVINPFDVYADFDGYRADYGRPTLFATFYEYTGPNLAEAGGGSGGVNLVTVGDGTDSYGSFYGPTAQVMQEAIDSLWPLGGTVFVSGGTYSYEKTVRVPENINVVGLSPNAEIWSQDGDALFRFIGSNSSVQGLQMFSDGTRGAVEFSSDVTETIEHVSVKNNIIWSNETSKGVTFAPQNSGVIYKNCTIENNQFKSTATSTIYIGETAGGDAEIDGLVIRGNHYDATTSTSWAINISGTSITRMSRVKLEGEDHQTSDSTNALAIELNNGQAINDFECLDAYQAGSLSVFSLVDSSLHNSRFLDGITVADDVVRTTFTDGYLGNVYISGSATDYAVRNSICGIFSLEKVATRVTCTNSKFNQEFFIKGEFGSAYSGIDIEELELSDNTFEANVYLSRDLTSTDTHSINRLKITNNHFQTVLSVGDNPADGAVTLVYTDVSISGNTIENALQEADAIKFGNASVSNSDFTINHLNLSDNHIVRGDVTFLNNVIFNSSGETSSVKDNKFEEQNYGVYFVSADTNNIEVSRNSLARIIFFGESSTSTTLVGSDPATPSNITISHNYMKDSGSIIALAPVEPSNHLALTNVAIENNVFLDDGFIFVLNSSNTAPDYRINDLSVIHNYMPYSVSSINIGPSVNLVAGTIEFNDSKISYNKVGGDINIDGIPAVRLGVENNNVSGTISFGRAVSSSTVSDNIMGDVIFSDTVGSSVFADNNVHSTLAIFAGALTSVMITGNEMDVNLTCNSTLTGCTLSNNRVSGTISNGAIDNCTLGNNIVAGVWTSTTWDNSVFSDNTLASNFVGTTANDSTFNGSRIEGNFTLTALSNTTLGDNAIKGGTGLTLSSLDTCTISNNVVANTFDITGNVATSTITGNRTDRFDIGGTTDNSTITGNISISNGASLTGALTDSTLSNNSFQSTSATSAFTSGTFADCNITGNLFKSTSGGAAVTSFGNMDTTTFTGNNIEQAAAGAVSFGTVSNSRIANLVIDATAVTCGPLSNSSLLDAYMDATFTISNGTDGALINSNISESHFMRDFTLTMTSDANPTLISSKITNNHFEAAAVINGAGVCLRNSSIQSNYYKNSLFLNITGSTGTYALDDSALNDNNIESALVINNTSGSATNANIARRATIHGNRIGGNCLIGGGVHPTNNTNLFEEVEFDGNYVGGELIFGPMARGYDITTYLSSTFVNNVINGNMSMHGAMVGCNFNDSVLNGDQSLFELISGSNVNDNVFGADGYGLVILNGGIQNNGSFSSNFVASDVNVPRTLNSAKFNNNTINGSFDVNAVITDSVLLGNICSGTTNINAGTTDAMVNDNRFGDAVSFTGTSTSTVLNDNKFEGILTFNDTISGVSLDSNYSTSALNILGSVSNFTMDGNRFGAVLMDANSTKDEVVITNNLITTLFINNSILSDAVIDGNRISSTVDLSTSLTLTRVVFSNNTCGASISFGTISRSSVDSNYANSVISFDDTVSFVSISNNTTLSNLAFATTVSQSQILGNNIENDTSFSGSIDGTSFIGNVVGAPSAGVFTASGALDDCMFSANDFRNTTTFPTANVTNTTFTGNHVDGTFSVSSGNFSYDGFNINGNVFNGSFSLAIPMTNSSVNGNTFSNTVSFSSAFSTSSVANSLISNNSFASSVSISFSGTAASSGALYRSTLSGNRIGSTFTIDAVNTTSGSSCWESVISGNTVLGLTTLSTNGNSSYILTDTAITGNSFGPLSISHDQSDEPGCLNSVIDGNTIDGNLSIHPLLTGIFSNFALDNCIVSNNTIDGQLTIANVSRDGDQITYSNSIVSGNSCTFFRLEGRLDNTNIVNNRSIGSGANFQLGAIWNSRISGNIVEDTTGTASIFLAQGAGSSTLINQSIISDNDFTGNLSIPSGTVSDSRFMNNRFGGTFSASDAVMSGVNFGGNYFGDAVTTQRWLSVACSGNHFASTLLTSTASTPAMDDVTFHNNVCQNTVQFTKTVSGATNDYIHSSFVGNVFDGTITFGQSGISAEFTRVIFNSNSGDGGLTINQGASTEMDSCMIVGNSMSGTLSFQNPYSLPPTSGTADVMIALNWFTGYSNVTFNDGQAIGWGDNTGSTAVTGVNGSNLTSSAT